MRFISYNLCVGNFVIPKSIGWFGLMYGWTNTQGIYSTKLLQTSLNLIQNHILLTLNFAPVIPLIVQARKFCIYSRRVESEAMPRSSWLRSTTFSHVKHSTSKCDTSSLLLGCCETQITTNSLQLQRITLFW